MKFSEILNPQIINHTVPKAHFFARMHAIFDLIKDNIMFGKGGLGGLMKQAQQMQRKNAKMQEEIAQLEVTGESWCRFSENHN